MKTKFKKIILHHIILKSGLLNFFEMGNRDIYKKPFDEGTIAKLDIFEHYLDSWLPTFIKKDFGKPIQIFDLFAGEGYDINGIEGGSLRILRVIKRYKDILSDKKINLYLNDIDTNKIQKLENLCKDKIKELEIENYVNLYTSNISFREFLYKNKDKLNYGCNLIFADQNGFKEITKDVFQFLINLETTDFLFFISSTYIKRFANSDEVKKYHPDFDFTKIKYCNYKKIHNVICEEFEKYVPENIGNYLLIPFSIMKEDKKNVYGLIFVSKHIRGIDKFLYVAWKKNNINGNANFDIEKEYQKNQLGLFEYQQKTKIEVFQENLEKLILNKVLKSNVDVYIYTLNQGHIPAHAKEKIMEMKKNGLIYYDSRSPLINYNKIFNENRIINFTVLNEKDKN